ncbi:GAF domain-containing sensor histidine kinase [Streptomyces sp. VRA16 Mangrove soil]|uniref:sensor histidine kinase n=1 Tax=Streptomyces sp. VRA16 Mangrove soil TaxID=2817434 RepID=UPI001A9E2F30|nr:GAF domain-containing sensor histidine kinase [Streptomyces sp. VRA16 Mangrove soil]MBO1332919.1 GAF domain-containing protein [Streptomyces sp. VRA16 Mangrove soil]
MGVEEAQGPGPLPRLRLDELLEELQVRIDAVRGTRNRLQGLLEAVLSVGQELNLSQVLRRIVEAAVVLVDAEYGALGVIGEDRRKLSQFLPVGIDDELRARIGDLPSGHGLLGELIRHPEPLRLHELAEHPASSGFPPHHPPMHTFVGVPIRVRETVFGNLYLTQKRGGGDFDDEDVAVLQTLGAAAGVAVENARLYEEVRLRERWLQLSAEFSGSLLSGTTETEVLRLMVERAREITGADLGVITLVVPGSTELHEVLALGRRSKAHHDIVLPRKGTFAGAALAAGELVTSDDIRKDPRITYQPARWDGLGPAVAMPLGTSDRERGVLMLARKAEEQPFSAAELTPLVGFAGQATLALELSDRRRDAEQMSLLEDRDRIARDLHDLAIQRLFATGMTLQSAQRFVQHPEAAERLMRAVDDLDTTIKIIRSTIFGLRERDAPPTGAGLRIRVVRAVEEAARVLGFTPALRMEGLVDVDVPGPVADDVLAVLGEALTNVARHAQASAAEVALVVRGGAVTLSVLDDGVGISTEPDAHRSGLANLAVRADQRDGTVTTEPREGGGTRLVWTVPLDTKG